MDQFKRTSSKLASLLQIDQDAPVLFIGTDTVFDPEDFTTGFSCCQVISSQTKKGDLIDAIANVSDSSFEMIVFDTLAIGNTSEIYKISRMLMPRLTDNGVLILLIRNRFSLLYLYQAIRRIPAKASVSPTKLKKELISAGAVLVDPFLALPSFTALEEISSLIHGDINLLQVRNPLKRLFTSSRWYRFIHHDYVLFASKRSRDVFKIVSRIDRHISSDTSGNANIQLTRFDMRKRGALVLFLSDRTNRKDLIARPVTQPAIKKLIRENHAWADRIQNNDRIPDVVKKNAPVVYGKIDVSDLEVYIENQMPGILAWKIINNPKIEPVVFANAYSFIKTFNHATSQLTDINDDCLDELVSSEIHSILMNYKKYSGLINDLHHIHTSVRERLLNTKRYLVWGHGEYAYANILVEPSNGQLTGVIDWNRGRFLEFPGVDLINLILQRYRITNRADIYEAVLKCAPALIQSGFSNDPITEDYNRLFGLSASDFKISFAIFAIRTVYTFSLYPDSFNSRHTELAAMIAWTRQQLI